jgi:hypothetical protein
LRPLIIRAPYGLGDGIYVRPVIRDQALRREVYVDTPFPELYEDLGVRFLEPPTYHEHAYLRVQSKQIRRQLPSRWSAPPPLADMAWLYYSAEAFVHGSVYQAMAYKMPQVALPLWDLPDFGPSPFDTEDAPLAIVRPAVRRTEWDNPSRNPLPEYISFVAGDLKARGYAVVVICDLSPGEEWIVGEMPPHCIALTKGELSTRQLLAAVADASVLVGGVGWIVPAAIAYRKPAFVILGGNGGSNAPEKIIDERMDGSKIGFAWPEHFCRCNSNTHECIKTIPDLELQWNRWRASMCSLGHIL